MVAALIITFGLLAVSIGYWLWQAHKAAQRARRAFEPRIHTAAPHDAAYLAHQRAQFDPYDDRHLSMLLKRQAE